MGEYLKVLAAIKSCPKTFQSNYVRHNADLVAEAASRGHISCLDAEGRNTYVWELTTMGQIFLSTYGGAV